MNGDNKLETNETPIKDWIMNYLPILLVILLQTAVIILLPMFNFEDNGLSVEWSAPDIYQWIFTGLTDMISILTFVSFTAQGKLNIRDDPRKLEADKKLGKLKNKSFIPQSPKKFETKEYATKGIFTALSTFAACIMVTVVILNWDIARFIALVISGLISICMGILNMKKFETYYTHEYLQYADYMLAMEAEKSSKEKAIDESETSHKQTENIESRSDNSPTNKEA